MNLIERLSRRQLVVVTGKGGVGKTVVSATLGRAFAAPGRRTLVVEVDPRENLHQMMGRLLRAATSCTPSPGCGCRTSSPGRCWTRSCATSSSSSC